MHPCLAFDFVFGVASMLITGPKCLPYCVNQFGIHLAYHIWYDGMAYILIFDAKLNLYIFL